MKMVSPRPVEASEPHLRYVWPIEEDEDGEAVADMLRPLPHACIRWDGDARIRRGLFAEPPTGSGRAVELLGLKLPGTTVTDINKREVCMLLRRRTMELSGCTWAVSVGSTSGEA
jgi:hypothetical protein